MCGRFTLRTPMNVLIEHFRLAEAPEVSPRYNIAPTQPIAVVRQAGSEGTRHMSQLRWGLVPVWAKDARAVARMINARGETVKEKPAFRSAFRNRRCLIPADGYYEWMKSGSRKQPYYIRMHDDQPFAFAGLWDCWRGGDGEPPLETCTIITTEANDLTRPIHDRMPVILAEEHYQKWLEPELHDARVLQPLLQPFTARPMLAGPVSTYVNHVRHDDARCIEQQRQLF